MVGVAGPAARAREGDTAWVTWAWRSALLLCAAANVIGSWSYGLLDDNEGLYAAIAREMLTRGDWIVPHLNGLPYLEKPPLFYWALASSLAVFGDHEWAVRIVPWFFHVGTAALTGGLACRLGGLRAGRLGALIFLSSLGVALIDRTLLFDIPMTFFLTAALVGWLCWDEDGRPGDLRWAAAALAFGVLSKGFLVLVLAGGTIGVTLAITGRLHRLKAAFDPWAVLIFGLLAVPWHVAAVLRQPGFAWFYFVNEHILRFLNRRQPHDYNTGPVWYYLVRLPLYLFPWCALLPRLAWPERRRYPEVFLWVWVGCVLALFSFSGSKGNYYALPAVPPLAVLLALRLERGAGRRSVLAWGVLAAVGIAPVLAAVPLLSAHEERWSQRTLVAKVDREYPGLPVYLFRDFEAVSSFPYYLGGRVQVIDCASADLYYGLRLRPQEGVAITEEQLRRRTAAAPALVVVTRQEVENFQRRFPEARRLPPSSDRALVYLVGSAPRESASQPSHSESTISVQIARE